MTDLGFGFAFWSEDRVVEIVLICVFLFEMKGCIKFSNIMELNRSLLKPFVIDDRHAFASDPFDPIRFSVHLPVYLFRTEATSLSHTHIDEYRGV